MFFMLLATHQILEFDIRGFGGHICKQLPCKFTLFSDG